ncbi:MAG: hypothetical protein HFF62_12630 [Oscillospiraceae bacterium]|nr:hypothetical protein [Oscillospiraceae bacterium]
MTRDHFERLHYYNEFMLAATEASRAGQAFENMKAWYDEGVVSAERVRAAEDRYLAAKAERDRLFVLSNGDPLPDPNIRWQPARRS